MQPAVEILPKSGGLGGEAPRVQALTRIKWLSTEQVERFLKLLKNPRDRAIFTVAYYRGLRASEVALISLKDWRPTAKRLYVWRIKGGLSGEYTVSPEESRAINSWIADRGAWDGPLFASERVTATGRRGISRQRLDSLMRAYGADAELPEDVRHFHVWRHSIAVHLTEAGESLQAVKDWLGHRSITSTQIYAQLTNKGRDAVGTRFYAQREGGGEKAQGFDPVKFKRNKR